MLADNKMEESCHIIDKYAIGSFFNWNWEGQLCRFDTLYMISFYTVVLLVYSLLKGYRYKQEKSVISPRFMFGELSGYLLVYYILLLIKIINSGLKLDFDILFNGIIGGLQFFIPIILYVGLIGWVGYKDKGR